MYYITESTKKAKGKRYKCLYCDYRNYKDKLVDHIENEHESLIPENYTAARLVFNIANNKDHGTCVCGCGKETEWREDLWRYDRYATTACKERYRQEFQKRMEKRPDWNLNDPNIQNKMLKNRSISGTYKFSHGGTLDYVGSFEKKFLEFCDKVMNYRCSDIEQPGPTIEYTYNGEKHLWITDYYIPSANLVLDIKDGGDNPNNRDMEEYREKQKCKEAAIIADGRYNYIRLTNNNFAQLMLILAEIKLRLVDNNNKEYKPIIRINEGVSLNISSNYRNMPSKPDTIIKYTMEAILGVTPNGRHISDMGTYVLNYKDEETGEINQGFSTSPDLNYILTNDPNGEIVLKDRKYFQDMAYKLYKFNGVRNKLFNKPTTLFEAVTGNRILDYNQLDYDNRFEEVSISNSNDIQEIVEATILGSKIKVPTITSIYMNEDSISSYYDENGLYIENTNTGIRSKSYLKESNIPNNVIEIIRKGEI